MFRLAFGHAGIGKGHAALRFGQPGSGRHALQGRGYEKRGQVRPTKGRAGRLGGGNRHMPHMAAIGGKSRAPLNFTSGQLGQLRAGGDFPQPDV